jgi:DNA-binding NtrC family response regulator
MADTLLLVADDQAALDDLGAHFERHGYEVLRESNREAAVLTFRARRPALVLLDIPPDPRGLALFAQLRQENAAVILLTRVREAEHLSAEQRARTPIDRRYQAHTLSEVERQHIERTLRHHGGNRTRAALELGISRATLINKIKVYSLNL